MGDVGDADSGCASVDADAVCGAGSSTAARKRMGFSWRYRRRKTSAGCSSTTATVETLVMRKLSARFRLLRSSSLRFQLSSEAAMRASSDGGGGTVLIRLGLSRGERNAGSTDADPCF